MSLYENLDTETFISGANLNGALYSLLKLDANGDVILSAAATDFSVGLLAHDPKRSQFDTDATTGDAVTVAKLKGKVPLKAGVGGVTAGQYVVAAAGGTIVDAAGSAAGGPASAVTGKTWVIGIAMKTAVAGEVVTVLAQPFLSGT